MVLSKNRWCKKAGCNNFQTQNGYCKEHQYMYVEVAKQKDARKEHTAHCQEAYDSDWTKVRNAFINENPLCEDCLARGGTTPAREVHHIKPIEFGGERLEWSNLVSLCSKCHHMRHKQLLVDRKIYQQIKKEN